MPVWCVTGKLGAGKTLVSVSRIKKYLEEGRRVATNLDLKLENFGSPYSKTPIVYRLPDVPTLESFESIGQGYDGELIGDNRNGLVVLDECALWLNSRDWNDKSRRKLINYFVHLRKLRWDLIILIQDEDALDTQFRKLYCEHTVYCSRADRFNIPFIGTFVKMLFGGRLPMPRVHIGTVMYNAGHGQTKVDTWFYRGTNLFNAFNTEQSFTLDNSMDAVYQYLPPYLVKGRYLAKVDYFKEKFSCVKVSHLFLAGLLAGGAVAKAFTSDGSSPDRGTFVCNSDWKDLFGDCELSKAQVKDAITLYKSSQGVGSSEAVTMPLAAQGTASEETIHPLDSVRITASIKLDSGQYEYHFVKGDKPFTPENYGYRVYDDGQCKATLIDQANTSDFKKVTCS